MNSNRKRITGRLEDTPRGLAIITDAGDRWVLQERNGDQSLIGEHVIAEGVVVGFDRLRVDWIGGSAS